MRHPASVTVCLLLAAASLSAASITISGAGGSANESYSTAINTGATAGFFTELGLVFEFDYLVVAGGGAGGTAGGPGGENVWGAGGGGAGGMVQGVGALYDPSQTFGVTVGAGGVAAAYSGNSTSNGGSGGNSALGGVVAVGGGGGGGGVNSSTGGVGLAGGSGGGGGGDNLKAGGSGTASQGYSGGTSRSAAGNRSAGGGGGGAGGAGQIGGPPSGHSTGIGGNGGVGLASSITGSSVYYGGGGGGGGRDTNSGATSSGGTGGTGGGGAGSGQGAATSGTDGLGGGGGGSGADGKGGDGGDGIVIVRYKGDAAGTGGVVSSGTGTSAGYTLHTFSTVGNSTLDLSSVNLGDRLGATVSSAVSGAGSLVVNTPGTIVFTGSATHTGGTEVQSGKLQLGIGATGGSLGGFVSIASDATLEYNRSGDATFSTLNGTGALTKKGTGTLTLAGTGTFSGSLRHEDGTLRVGSADGLGSSAVTLVGGALSSDGTTARSLGNAITVLDDVTLGDATNSGELTLSGGINLDGGTRALTVASSVVLSGAIANGSLVKAGSGKLVLSGDNSAFTGSVFADAGTLVVNSTMGAGYVEITSGAVLGGSGTIGGNLYVLGEHNPGNSPGIQTITGVAAYDMGAVINWELAANTTSNSPTVNFDQIVVGGNLNFMGLTTLKLSFASSATHTSLVDWSDAFWSANQSWTVFDVGGSTLDFVNLGFYSFDWLDAQGDAFGTALAGASFSLGLVGNDVVLNYTAAPAVPEPSTYGLILGGLALAGAAIRRRKQVSK